MKPTLTTLRERTQRDVLILFPERTRSRDGTLGTFKPGIGMIVAETTAPVIPCRIEGAFEAWPPGQRFRSPKKIRVTVGAPLCFEKISNERKGWEEVANCLQDAVAKLEGA
ncbi:MAG: lysophospholipid acyltransferase family protein [Verrucomicrobiota bacterium]